MSPSVAEIRQFLRLGYRWNVAKMPHLFRAKTYRISTRSSIVDHVERLREDALLEPHPRLLYCQRSNGTPIQSGVRGRSCCGMGPPSERVEPKPGTLNQAHLCAL